MLSQFPGSDLNAFFGFECFFGYVSNVLVHRVIVTAPLIIIVSREAVARRSRYLLDIT